MRRSALTIVMVVLLFAGAACSGPLFPVSRSSGTNMVRLAARAAEPARDWCTPDRGAPPDPTLGISAPLRIGVGSILTEQDGTTESFLAHQAWTRGSWLEDRQAGVLLVDHPTDADYAISGTIAGDLAYTRADKPRPGPIVATALGYTLGSSFSILGVVMAAVDEPSGALTTLGLVTLGVGLAGHVAMWRGRANRYDWKITGHFTLRRNGVRIGEFFVDESGGDARYEPYGTRYRPMVLGRLWHKARAVIAPCIAADVARGDQP